MLHKKSEYKLHYRKLDKDLRKKIWQDNVALRKSLLVTNQATHYWEYQLRDDICDCESGEDDDDEAPLPPHRLKHKNLREHYNQDDVKTPVVSPSLLQKNGHEIAVQTPEWNENEDLPDNRANDASEELLKNMSSLALPEVKDNQSRHLSPEPAKPSTSRARAALEFNGPAHASRTLHSENKRTHFVPFGWNEKNTDLGHKQTYNVRAPKKEVHNSAIHASRRKKAEKDQLLAQEKLAKHQTRSRERTTSSSLWMTEYQEQFTGCKSSFRSSRPLSAPPAPRHAVTWRHS